MQSETDFIEILKHEHDRLGRLLQTIDNGRWWTSTEPGRLKMSSLHEKVQLIRRAIDDMEQAVAHLGSA